MSFTALWGRVRALSRSLRERAKPWWLRYRALPRYQQALIAALAAALVLAGIVLIRSGGPDASATGDRTVALASVGELSGTAGTVDFIGTVRSISEADILAQQGGTVRSVHTRLGGRVPAGSVIAQLENASERAAVLQAEGVYDAAVAARSAQSLTDVEGSARDTYRSVFTALDNTLKNQIDVSLFGGPGVFGPNLLIDADYDTKGRLSSERKRLTGLMNEYELDLASAGTKNPTALLDEAESIARQVQAFLTDLSNAVNHRDSSATAAQLTALATARTNVNTALTDITDARISLRSDTVSVTASSDASVKQALGALRGAQATLERTIIRAPIAGQVNFLPIRVGDYVTALEHVATVAQNGSLEVVVYVSEENRDLLVVGGPATVDENHAGVITSIAPALDPTNKQVEVHVAVQDAGGLVNGQSVHVTIPDLAAGAPREDADPLLLPLASVKLRAGDRIVFSVGEDNRLVAHPVTVGDVRGDRIEVLTGLPGDLRIVADARGLAEGERVQVAP